MYCLFCIVLCIVCFVSFYVLFVCKCVLYCCHRATTQLQLTNILSSFYCLRFHQPSLIHDWGKMPTLSLPFLERASFHLDLCRRSMNYCIIRVRVCCVRNSLTWASVQSIALWPVVGHVCNWGCRSQSSGILDGIVRSICAICAYVTSLPTDCDTMFECIFHGTWYRVSICTILTSWRRSFLGITSWMTRNQAIWVDSGTGAALRFS
jgi:hypothetical protein